MIRREYSLEDSLIEVRDFRKSYGDFVAVDGISFDVQQGVTFALPGPIGVGKNGTLESLEGLSIVDRPGAWRSPGCDTGE
jgi:ABC-type multidrug transport system ATPase subunit